MKRFLKATLLLPLALTGAMLIAQSDPQAQPAPSQDQTQKDSQQTTTGKIAKSDDGKYVLVDSAGTMYQLDDQSAAKKFAGKAVKVSGTVDTSSNTIHVTDIKPAAYYDIRDDVSMWRGTYGQGGRNALPAGAAKFNLPCLPYDGAM